MLRQYDMVSKDDGQDIVEYALLTAFISIFAVLAVKAIGPVVNALYVKIQGAF